MLVGYCGSKCQTNLEGYRVGQCTRRRERSHRQSSLGLKEIQPSLIKTEMGAEMWLGWGSNKIKKPISHHTNFVITGGHTKEALDTPSCSRSSRNLKFAFHTTKDQD